MTTITPFLWFDDDLEEAIDFYTGVFPGAVVHSIDRMGDRVFGASFELCGQSFIGLNAGPGHPFTDAISMFVSCADQAEVDRTWDALLEGGGSPVQCGWLTDRFGLSWQVVPTRMRELLADPDRARAGRAMQAMMSMVKIDVAELERAANG